MDHYRAEPPGGEAEYQAIEAALMETARGRRFLAEYARRNRTADTDLLLGAICRLERAVLAGPDAAEPRTSASPGRAPAEARDDDLFADDEPQCPAPDARSGLAPSLELLDLRAQLRRLT